MKRLEDKEVCGDEKHCGLIERYLNLQPYEDRFLLKDISFRDGIRVGDDHCQLFTLADAGDLPGLCGSRINYDRFSTDRTKFSIGFASPQTSLSSNRFIFIKPPSTIIFSNCPVASRNSCTKCGSIIPAGTRDLLIRLEPRELITLSCRNCLVITM